MNDPAELDGSLSDAASLAALDAVCFPAAERWSEHLWSEQLAEASHWTHTLHVNGELVGAITISVVFDTAELFRVMVHPSYRGRGLARRLVAAALGESANRGAQRMLLEVRADNTAAIGLYLSLGFRQIAQRRDYYGPGATALVLETTVATPTGVSPIEPASHESGTASQ